MGPRILLVEDDSDLRGLFRLALETSGFQVREAADGLQAIGMVQIEEFDLVILDIAMPNIDGCAAIETFKRIRNARAMPIIVVTALNDPKLQERVYNAGAVAFINKPLTPVELVDYVRQYAAPIAIGS